MFYAKNNKHERISASAYLMMKDNQPEIFCPGCNEPIFFKNGVQKMPHFSHYSHAECQQFSEGESPLHLLGKQRLYEWLKRQGLKVEMEAWLPELRQRPDLLVENATGRKVAVEYQCSPISFADLSSRTKGYTEIGYEVIWLCGKDYQLGKNLSNKQSQFLHDQNGVSFLLYQSDANQLVHYSQFFYNQRNELQCIKNCYPLKKLSFRQLEVLYQGRVQVERRVASKSCPNRNHLQLLYRKDDMHRSFMERVYLARQNLHTLPKWLFDFPTKTLLYQEPAYIWKFDFLRWLSVKGEGRLLEREEVDAYTATIKVQPTLFMSRAVLHQPLWDFTAECIRRGILQSIGPDTWMIRKIF